VFTDSGNSGDAPSETYYGSSLSSGGSYPYEPTNPAPKMPAKSAMVNDRFNMFTACRDRCAKFEFVNILFGI